MHFSSRSRDWYDQEVIATSVKRLEEEADQTKGPVNSTTDMAKFRARSHQDGTTDHHHSKRKEDASSTNRVVPDHDLTQMSHRAAQRISSSRKWWRAAAVTVPRRRLSTATTRMHGVFDSTIPTRSPAKGDAAGSFRFESVIKTLPIVADVREAIGLFFIFIVSPSLRWHNLLVRQ